VKGEQAMQQLETKTQARQSSIWIGQAVSGVLLIVILLPGR
jgi:hypothetical protein